MKLGLAFLGLALIGAVAWVASQTIDRFDVSYETTKVFKDPGVESSPLHSDYWSLAPAGHFVFLRERPDPEADPEDRYKRAPDRDWVVVAPDGTESVVELENFSSVGALKVSRDGVAFGYQGGRVSFPGKGGFPIADYDGGCGLDYRVSAAAPSRAGIWVMETHADVDLSLYSVEGKALAGFDACTCTDGFARCCPASIWPHDEGVVLWSPSEARWLDNAGQPVAERGILKPRAISPGGHLLTVHPRDAHRWAIEALAESRFFDVAFLGQEEKVEDVAITDRFAYLLTIESSRNTGLRARLLGPLHYVARLHRFDLRGELQGSALLPVQGGEVGLRTSRIATTDDERFFLVRHQVLSKTERLLLSTFRWAAPKP